MAFFYLVSSKSISTPLTSCPSRTFASSVFPKRIFRKKPGEKDAGKCIQFWQFCYLFRKIALFLSLVNMLQIFLAGSLLAHGVEYKIAENSPSVSVDFYYSNGEPMAYAEILIFSPVNRKIEHQNGRTDKNGRFSFLPDVEGEWHIEVSDGMGHKISAEVLRTHENSYVKQEERNPIGITHSPMSCILGGILLGISVIFNIFFGLNWWNRTKDL